MSKLKLLSIVLLSVCTGIFSCSDDDPDNVIDCLFEGAYFKINHTADSNNVKTITFTVTYDGEETLDNNIKWDFGDGSAEQTISGTTATHTYTNSGDYTVKIKPTVRNGDAYCTVEKELNITVN